ncbi:MAG: TIGR03086 family metal-binding protein [Chloroflexota bacterium]
MPAAAPIDRLTRALDATGQLIAAVTDDQWSNPTPCPGWNVRALVNHLVVGNQTVASILRDEPQPPPETLREMRTVDRLGDDPLAAYRAAGDALVTAFSEPSVLDRVVRVPVGPVPGAVLLHLRITELLVHGWDLACATGQPPRLPDDLAEEELAFARGPQAPDVPRTGHPFGPPQSVDAEAPAIVRLVAYLGRQPASAGAEAGRG